MTAFGSRLRVALLGRRRSGIRGAGRTSVRRSDGYEFAELRAYVEGDDPRRIDWAATARAGGLQTRVVYEDASLAFATALDASPSMFVGREQTNYARAREAARTWYAAATDDDRCYRIGATVLAPADARGRAAAAVCAEAHDMPGTTLSEELELGLATLPRDARLLIVSDFFELTRLARVLRSCAVRFDVTALVSGDPWSGRLPLGGFARLRDATTLNVARVYVDARARARYAAAVAEREASVLSALAALGLRSALLEANPETALATALGL